MKTKKSVLVVGLVVLVGTFAYYRYAKDVFQSVRYESLFRSAPKEVSAEVTYGTPGEYSDTLRFVVKVDGRGVIQNIQTLDAKTGEVPEKKKPFNEEVNVLLRGKKLKDIDKIDKVAKASMTTAAFNDALDDLKAGL